LHFAPKPTVAGEASLEGVSLHVSLFSNLLLLQSEASDKPEKRQALLNGDIDAIEE